MLLSRTMAYDLVFSSSNKCTGLHERAKTNVIDGCIKIPGGAFTSAMSTWESETDNDLLIAFYSHQDCCHQTMLDTVTWTDGCYKLPDGATAWRVVNPEKPEEGKTGQDYVCY